MTTKTLLVIWVLASFAGVIAMIFATISAARDWNGAAMKYLTVLFASINVVMLGLLFVGIRVWLNTPSLDTTPTVAQYVIMAILVQFVLASSAFALRLMGWLRD